MVSTYRVDPIKSACSSEAKGQVFSASSYQVGNPNDRFGINVVRGESRGSLLTMPS